MFTSHFLFSKIDADDEKALQIGDHTEGTSGSNGGGMSITEEEANEASNGLETEDEELSEGKLDNRKL